MKKLLDKGHTLLETLIVLAIVGILAGIAMQTGVKLLLMVKETLGG